MAISASVLAASFAALTILASIAEIVLASWILHDLHVLHDQFNYSYDGVQGSSADPTTPDPVTDSFTFEEPWVIAPISNAWALPRVQLATGVIAFVFGISICVFLSLRKWSSRNSGPRQFATSWGAGVTAGSLLTVVTAAITAMFIYATYVSSHSADDSHIEIDGGEVAYDAKPTWEVWTCAISSLLEQNTDIVAARSEWKTVCQVNVSQIVAIISYPGTYHVTSSRYREGQGGP